MKNIFSLLLLSSCAGAPSYAQQPPPPCYDIEEVTSFLSSRYGEIISGQGLSGQNIITQWTNPVTGSFTITTSTTDGVTCLVVSGEGWTNRVEPPNL